MWKVASFWMFLDIVEKNDELKQKLNEKDLRFIKELIEGVDTADPQWPATGRSKNKAFLYEIVINKWNGIDVHRWDYFARDCHHLGIPNSFDHQRLLESARVCKVNGRNHICFRDKVADNVYDMFRTQYTLYSQAYQHKIGNISQKKIIDALLEARDKLPKISPIAVSKLQDDIERKIRWITGVSSHTHEDDENSTELNREMREFAKLTDHIFEEILYSSDVGLEGARKKLEDVVKRRLPKCVGETRLIKRDNLDHKKALNQTLQNMWNKAVDEWNKLHPAVFLDKKDFSTEVIQLDCTHSTGKNPIDNVYFYRKWNLTEAFKIKKYEVSSLLPEEFTEYVGRVYYTKNSVEEEMDAKECFKWWCLGKCVIELYDQHAFKGTKCVITGNCPSLDHCSITEVRSCKVIRGVWKLWKGRGYNGDDYLLKEGDYPNLKALSDCKSTASAPAPAPVPDPAWSLVCLPFMIHLYEKVNFEGPIFETTVDHRSLDGCGINEVHSCKVLSGVWDLYGGPDYAEPRYQLQKGEYPNPGSWCASDPTAPALSVKCVTE
uniref:Beta/gamma crystallin 'Greek key' domain-containing protein n=1 Tax=Cyprinus carpio carpio TaxID=630221 RepID=A0A9J7X6H9_CYPCA